MSDCFLLFCIMLLLHQQSNCNAFYILEIQLLLHDCLWTPRRATTMWGFCLVMIVHPLHSSYVWICVLHGNSLAWKALCFGMRMIYEDLSCATLPPRPFVWLLIVHIAMTIFGFHCLWTKSLLMLGTPKPGVLPALAILHAYGPTTFANPYAYVTHPCPVYLFYMHAWYYFLNNTYACDPAMAKWSANPLLFLTIHCIYVYILLLVAYVAHWSAYVHSYCSQLFPYMCSLYVLHWFCLCLSLQWSA